MNPVITILSLYEADIIYFTIFCVIINPIIRHKTTESRLSIKKKIWFGEVQRFLYLVTQKLVLLECELF